MSISVVEELDEHGEGRWRVSGLANDITVVLALRPDRTLICSDLHVRGEQITARWLRHTFKLGEIVDEVALQIAAKLDATLRGQRVTDIQAKAWRGEPSFSAGPLPQPREAPVTPALLKEIAQEYRRRVKQAERRGERPRPVLELAGRKRWSNGQVYRASNLRRLLGVARQRGYLGRAIHGTAGERRARRKKR